MPDLAPTRSFLGHRPGSLLMSHDGRQLYAICDLDDVICVIDAVTCRVTATIACPDLYRHVTLTHDGRLYTMAEQGVVAIVDTVTRSVIGTIQLGGRPSGGVVSPDGRLAYVPLGNVPLDGPMGIAVIDTTDNVVTETVEVGVLQTILAMSPTGDRICAADESGSTLVVVETETMRVLGAPIGVDPDMDGMPGLAVGPGGRQVFVLGMDSGVVRVVDTDNFEVTAERPRLVDRSPGP